MAPPGMEEMTSQLQQMFSKMGGSGRRKTQKLRVREAYRLIRDEEAARFVNEDELKVKAIDVVENSGIVFIDEIDKVAKRGEGGGTDVSREGVQRDLLPLIEGCTVSTKYGMVKTDHVLFIASGAFHLAKPSDLIPELQGRLPIRVELSALSPEDFQRILTEPKCSLTEQYKALLDTEGLKLEITEDCIRRIAEVAWQVNERTENIGARRLHTVLEKLLEEISFDADSLSTQYHDKPLVLDAEAVDRYLGELADDEDLSRYIVTANAGRLPITLRQTLASRRTAFLLLSPPEENHDRRRTASTLSRAFCLAPASDAFFWPVCAAFKSGKASDSSIPCAPARRPVTAEDSVFTGRCLRRSPTAAGCPGDSPRPAQGHEVAA